MSDLAIQDRLFAGMTCFGCGPANADGLRLKSYVDGSGLVVAAFTPWPQHDNGLGFLNGGIIATLLDCHSGAVMAHTADSRGWGPLGDLPLAFVTAGLDVRYLRPSSLHEPVTLTGWPVEVAEDEMTIAVSLEWDGKTRAEASTHWKRWRPR